MKNILSDKYKELICIIADELNKRHINWLLAGSNNLRLQGVKCEEESINIVCDKEGAEIFEEVFVDFIIKPVIYSKTDKYKSYYGVFNIAEIKVEVMGDLEIFDTEHKVWIKAIDTNKIITKTIGSSLIFANSLDHELEIYRALGQINMAQIIIKDFIEKFK